MRFGYARVSSDDKNLDRQRVALGREDCAHVVEATMSSVMTRRRLDALLGTLKAGDELIVTEVDRLGRGTGNVIMILDELTRRGIILRILAIPSLDISTDDGLIADILASFAAHERRRTSRRQEQGIAAAGPAGRHLERPRKLNGQQVAEARLRIKADEPARSVARAYGVDVKTLRSTLHANRATETHAESGEHGRH